jgi:hypothetical protein
MLPNNINAIVFSIPRMVEENANYFKAKTRNKEYG